MLAPTTRTLLCLVTAGAVGCSSPRKTDVLEARLRSQEDLLTTYQSEMTRVKSELASARRETEDLRLQLADGGQNALAAEESGALFRATGIQLSSLMTGGMDIDGQPGHDGLTVVLIPHDADGELVKLPGTIEIEAFDPSAAGGAQRIGQWSFGQRDIHEFWHKGVVQSGYQFQLPWQTLPQTDEVLVLAHLSTANGRQFDTTLTVKIDPPADGIHVPLVDGVQQAAGREDHLFDVRHADAEHTVDRTATDDRILQHGFDAPAALLHPAETRESFSGKSTESASSRTPAALPRHRLPRPATPREQSRPTPDVPPTDRQVPPPIEDWWSDDDWATRDAVEATGGVPTSDAYTEQIRPWYR